MDLEQARQAFNRILFDLLADMETSLLSMVRSGPDQKRVLAVFLAARTIGDSASLFDLERIQRLAHAMERILGEVHGGRLALDEPLLNTLLEGIGILEGIMPGKGFEESEETTAEEHLLATLERFVRHADDAGATSPAEPATAPRAASGGSPVWHISARFDRNCLKRGLDPLSPLHQLERFGIIEQLDLVDDALPPLPALDPELLHLGFEVRYRAQVSRRKIEEVFAYFEEGSDIRLIPPGSTVDAYLALLKSPSRPSTRLGEILVSCGALTPRELERALEKQTSPEKKDEPLGMILVEEQVVPPPVVEAALERQKALRDGFESNGQALKVEPARLDALVNQIGELVMASATARLVVSRTGDTAGSEALEVLSRLVEGVRDAALGLRMIPVGNVFQRFPELVREISKEAGKDVQLAISGADTELDKSLVERLAESLARLVRHAIEHGIEPETTRIAAGKPPHGTIRFNAWRETGNLVVEMSDDGAGFAGPMADNFCLAEDLASIRKDLESMRGEVEVESDEGAGTTFRLRLPLTLSIIDGFRFLVGKTSYVVPLDSIQECADLPPGGVQAGVVRLRDEPLPYVRLRDLFAATGAAPARESLVVVQHGSVRAGLVVDQLAGELQAVVKPLGAIFQGLRAVSGTAILGDGNVALVLNVPDLVRSHEPPNLRNAASARDTVELVVRP